MSSKAMMKQKLATMISRIENKEQWDELIAQLNGRLLFIDVHKEWAGPCSIMQGQLENIFLNTEAIESRLQFCSVHEKSGVEHSSLDEFFNDESCKPRFILLLNGNVVANIHGAMAPELVRAIHGNLPDID